MTTSLHEPAAAEVGRLLREARLACGKELAVAAEELRIRPTHLEALEEGRLGRLLAPVYVVGQTRAYAKHLGLDGAELARRLKMPGGRGGALGVERAGSRAVACGRVAGRPAAARGRRLRRLSRGLPDGAGHHAGAVLVRRPDKHTRGPGGRSGWPDGLATGRAARSCGEPDIPGDGRAAGGRTAIRAATRPDSGPLALARSEYPCRRRGRSGARAGSQRTTPTGSPFGPG
jgi:hypothetical protein